MKLTSQIALGILTSCIISCSFMREVDIYEPSKSISAFKNYHKPNANSRRYFVELKTTSARNII